MMKKIYYLLITILIFNSCISTTGNKSEEPLWYQDSFSYLSESKNIIFKASAFTYELAEQQILEDSKYLSEYSIPKKVKEAVTSEGIYYLLYSIEKYDFQLELEKSINIYNLKITNSLRQGDKTSNLMEKFTLYNEGLDLVKKISAIKSIAEKESLNVQYNSEITEEQIQEKMNLARNEIFFNVKVTGDIDGILESGLVNELHKLGYRTSSDGSVILDTVLILRDVDLDNGYLNKFWSVTVNLQDFYGESNKSLTYKGRDSQLNEESLKQLIAYLVIDKIVEDLNTILP